MFGFRRRQKADRPAAPVVQRRAPSKRWDAVQPVSDRRVRVVALERETADAVSVTLEPCDAGRFIHTPGQYLTHCLTVDGEPRRRAYSISAADGERRLTCTVKRVADGRVSRYINEQLAVGDEYAIRGPSGEFTLSAAAAGPLAFVAAGSGITPVIHLIDTALATEPERPVTLIYANRREQDIIFRARLDALAADYPGFTLRHVLSAPEPGWDGASGHVSASRLRDWVPELPEATLYLCGPAGLMDALGEDLAAGGVVPGRTVREDFRSAPHATAAHPTTEQTLHFTRSGEQVTQAVGQSILDAGLAAGLALDFSCTVGGCAACKIRLGKGEVVHDEPHCLSDAERAAGWILACSAYASGPVELDA